MNTPTQAQEPQPSRRDWVALTLTLLGTLVALTWVWMTPDQSGSHFWWVAQAIPVVYVLLLWWVHGISSDESGER